MERRGSGRSSRRKVRVNLLFHRPHIDAIALVDAKAAAEAKSEEKREREEKRESRKVKVKEFREKVEKMESGLEPPGKSSSFKYVYLARY